MNATGITRDEHLMFLDHAAKQVSKAKDALAQAERKSRIDATLAVRGGVEKTAIAACLGISRPTLDAWIAKVETTADEIADVEQSEYFVARESNPATAIHRR